MNKKTLSFCLVGLFCLNASAFQLGLEFGVGNDVHVGTNMRFTELFELKPQLAFGFGEDYGMFDLIIDANFYLPELGELQHYAGPGISLNVESGNNNGVFTLNGHYGLRYNINDIVSIFGQIGFGMEFDPFVLKTFRNGVGITFYLPTGGF